MDLQQFKQGQRFVWGLGDYQSFAELIDDAAALTVERSALSPGERVLDVATGSGNGAVRAARAGAQVTGLDLSPALLELARGRAGEEGLEIDWIEGDAEALPFADDEFDRVLSVFGAIFAPQHQRTAGEMLRVTRPGGTVALTAWVPDGAMARMIAAQSTFIPPPADAESPALWGDEDHARAMLASAAEVSFERATIPFRAESIEDFLVNIVERLPPVVGVRAAVEGDGRWPEARARLHDLWAEANRATDGSFAADADYLLISARA